MNYKFGLLILLSLSMFSCNSDVKFESEKWKGLDEKLKAVGVKIVYFPYTKGTSSTLINTTLKNLREKGK